MSNKSSSKGQNGSTTCDVSLSYSTSFRDQNTEPTPADSRSRQSQDPPMTGFEIPFSLESNSRENLSIEEEFGFNNSLAHYGNRIRNDFENFLVRVISLEEEVQKLKSEKDKLEVLSKELQSQYCESKKQMKSFLRDLAASRIAGDIKSEKSKLLMEDIQNCQSVMTDIFAKMSSTSQYDSEKLIAAFENWKY